MGQILVRQIDDAALARLKARAEAEGRSVESLARDAIVRSAAEMTREERRQLLQDIVDDAKAAVIAGVPQTPAAQLIREDRDR